MSQPYTKRLIEVAAVATTATAVVPAGKVWIVTDINIAAGPNAVTTVVNIGRAGGAVFYLQQWAGTSADVDLQWHGKAVLNAGETLQCVTTTSVPHVTITGYELDAT